MGLPKIRSKRPKELTKAAALILSLVVVASACSAENAGLDESATDAASDGEYYEESAPAPLPETPNQGREDSNFEDPGVNPRVDPSEDPQSTFALDVDTGSYTLARSWINEGRIPTYDSVRVEEYVNYFDQGYEAPTDGTFAIHTDGGPTPFLEDDSYRLLRIGLQSQVIEDDERPGARLTFVVDVSGSMAEPIEDVKQALNVLIDELRPTDEVAIVAYGSEAYTILDHTPVSENADIRSAIDRIQTEGSTNAEAGLELGYREADEAFLPNGINRVILLSDGVANVGATGPEAILETIENAAGEGINLVTVGFGDGQYNDALMEQLADSGDGFYAYVDGEQEAVRLFRDDLTGTLLTVANDAKIQVEFDTNSVTQYRLIGFENRAIRDEDFDRQVDAGEIGAGHSVTALYEVQLVNPRSASDELAVISLRWEDPETGERKEMTEPVSTADLAPGYDRTAPEFQLTSTVAWWGEILRESPYVQNSEVVTLDAIAKEANRISSDVLADSEQASEFADLATRTSRGR